MKKELKKLKEPYLVIISHGRLSYGHHDQTLLFFDTLDHAKKMIKQYSEERIQNPLTALTGNMYEFPKFRLLELKREYNISEEFTETTEIRRVRSGVKIED